MIRNLHFTRSLTRSLAFAALAIFMILPGKGWGQIAAWDFTGVGGTTLPTYAATTFNANLVSTSGANTITRGSTAAWSTGSNSFRTVGFKNEGISTANTDYFQITLAAATGYKVSLSTIDAKFNGTGSFFASPGVTSQFAYSLDGTSFTLIGSPVQSTSLTMTQIAISGISALQNVAAGTTITLRYYASGQTATGGWGFNSPSSLSNGLAIGGTIAAVASTDATLSSMAISAGTLTPAFATGTITYTATVPYSTSSINITPTVNESHATVKVNGVTATSGSPSTVSLSVGANAIPVLVTAQDGSTTKTYTITVTRTAAATVSTLSNMVLSDGTLSPSFASGTISYSASVPYTTSSITVTPTKTNSFASIQVQVNGGGYSTVASGSPSSSLSLTAGTTNTIELKVTAEDGSFTTYTTTVTRAAVATDASLSALTTTAGALTPTFATGTLSYTASVDNATASVTVTPTKANAFATIQVRVNSGSYTSVTSGNASGALALNEGNNPIDVKVTAQDGSTIVTYTITVTRAVASVPTISAVGTLLAVNTTYGSASATPTSFAVSGSAMTEGILVTPPNGYEVSLSSGSGYGATITVGAAGTISVTDVYVRLKATATYAGSPYSGNVVLTSAGATEVDVATASSTVAQAQLTISNVIGVNRPYDGGTAASVSGTPAYVGLVNGETYGTVTGSPTFSFADATAANGKSITIGGGGYTAPTTNYTVTQPSLTADITPVGLTITGLAGVSRAYNTTNVATLSGTATYFGLVNSESFTVTGTYSATFVDANVGTAKAITVTGYTAPSVNYTVTQPTGLTADITKADQTITFGALASKSFGDADFSLTATASSGLSVSYTSSLTSVATVSGSTVHIAGVGSTDITASQSGDGNYNAAPNVIQPQVVAFSPVALATWNFGTTSGSAAPSGVPANLTIGSVSQGNNNGTTTLLTTTSPSDNTGASGSYNAGAAARVGGLSTATNGSAYFEFIITPSTSYAFKLTSISFGARSTTTGPQFYTLRSSIDNYGSDITTGSIGNNSTWSLKSNSGLTTISSSATTFRIYGYNGAGSPSANTANWRIDDLILTGNVLNTPTVYAMTGGGSYCAGGSGVVVGLAGSQLGVNYQLYIGGTTPVGLVVAGTGSAISFGTQTAGTYTAAGTADGSVQTLGGTTAMTGSAVITVTASGTWLGTSSTSWNDVNNWCGGIPTTSTNVIIPSGGNQPTIDITTATCNNLTINSGAVLTIAPGKALTVIGTLTNTATTGLVIKSDATGTGSLLNNTASVPATVERYITGGWSAWDGGWHQISSPVASQAISDFTTTGAGNGYDLYGWDEPTNYWMNYKAAGFDTWNSGSNNFNTGQGYFISYQLTQAGKSFTGNLNTANITKTDLSKTGTQTYTAFHLLGNPFASALRWNDGNWALSNVAGTTKTWSETSKSYSDIAANGIIPISQGFMVEVTSATNSITIPAASRVHSATAWYKSAEESARIFLVASENEGGSAQESQILVNEFATPGYDFNFDSHFLAGYAPQFYSMAGAEMLSTNTLPAIGTETLIPFGFVKNNATNFTIELKEKLEGLTYYLKDLKTNTTQNLTDNPVYTFTASPGDDAGRFELSFLDVTSIPEAGKENFTVYFGNGTINILSRQAGNTGIRVSNMLGQVMLRVTTNGNSHTTLSTNSLQNGVYVVSLVGNGKVVSRKVVVSK
jgi:hypothetical protein